MVRGEVASELHSVGAIWRLAWTLAGAWPHHPAFGPERALGVPAE
jgi:hypothetical protein